MILLYSLEYGKISVCAKGVRKPAAKLKFACDQFCFGEYELAKTGDRYTLKICNQLESFYSLREDIFAYYGACTVAECLMNLTEEGQSDSGVFVILLKTLQQLTEKTEPLLVTLKFILDFLELDGFKLDFSRCAVCGKSGKMFLDLQRGGVVCDSCRSINSVQVGAQAASVCKMLDGFPYEKLNCLRFPQAVLKEALNVCGKFLAHSFLPMKSLSEFLNLA